MALCDQDLKTLLAADLTTYFYLLVEAYERRLYGFIFCRLRQSQDTEDIVQDTFVNAYRALQKYTWLQIEELKLKAWLFTIAYHLALNHKSRIGAHQSQMDSINVLEEKGHLEGTEDSHHLLPEIEMERKEAYAELYVCIGQLPEGYREVISLHYIAELSYPEIAVMLNQPLNTTKNKGYRGLEKLKEMMKG